MAGTSLTRSAAGPGWPTGRRFEGRRALGAIFPETHSVGIFWRFLSGKHNRCYRVFCGGPTSRPGGAAAFSSPSFGGLEFGELRYAARESHNQLKYHKITVLWKIATCGKLQKKAPNDLKSLDAELKSAPAFRNSEATTKSSVHRRASGLRCAGGQLRPPPSPVSLVLCGFGLLGFCALHSPEIEVEQRVLFVSLVLILFTQA
jgi:hypothetical protein